MASYKSVYDNDGIVEEIVEDAIEHIWVAFEAGVHSKYLDGMRLPFTAKLMIEKMEKMVALAMLTPDGVFQPNSNALEVRVRVRSNDALSAPLLSGIMLNNHN